VTYNKIQDGGVYRFALYECFLVYLAYDNECFVSLVNLMKLLDVTSDMYTVQYVASKPD